MRSTLATVVLAATFASAARAQTPAPPRVIEETVVTATAAPLPADSIGRTVTVLTRELIQQLGIGSVIDALRLAPGVELRARGPRGVQTDISIRGATFGQHLVLADGIRLNNSQSGHHNAEMPIPLASLDRLEIVHGGASALHGADALGGVVQAISRADRHIEARLAAGQHGTVELEASQSGTVLPRAWLLTGWLSRSGGFAFDRDHLLGGIVVRGPMAGGWRFDVRHQRRAFGANGFYGPSPSKEWTNQTVAGLGWLDETRGWQTEAGLHARQHGDHFRWDIARPGFAENRHRTRAAVLDVRTSRLFQPGARLTFGGSTGLDRITSSNLGNHSFASGAAFGELVVPLGDRAAVQTGLRWDGYSNFGRAWSPSVAFSAWRGNVRLRASAAKAFRVPSFTELHYRDPSNLGSPDLVAERGWSLDAGIDGRHHGWDWSLTPFVRWDDNVIDWVRASPEDLWRSTNVRDVATSGVEASAGRIWSAASLRASYTALWVDAPALDVLSKYVLEYSRHAAALSLAVPAGAGFRVALTGEYRLRHDGQEYVLAGARVSRRSGTIEWFVEATNLLGVRYREIAGVDMPGRWVMAGLALR
jgi:iron complex outermembrane receptor protein